MDTTILYTEAGVATQIMISAEDNHFIVDVGDGSLRDLLNLKVDLGKIKGIFLTHGHYDHIGRLYALLGHFRVMERKEPIEMYYPEGCKECPQIINAFKTSYNDLSFKINIHEVTGQDEVELNNVKIKIYQMKHYAAVGVNQILHPDSAVGYRFNYKGKSVAISGDTGLCPGLIELVQGADFALIDSTLDKNEVTEELLEKLHLSRERAEDIGKLAKKFIPIHQHKT